MKEVPHVPRPAGLIKVPGARGSVPGAAADGHGSFLILCKLS